MDTRLAVISLWAEDIPAAVQFYRGVIRLKLLPQHAGDRIHVDQDGYVLAIHPGHRHFCRTPNLASRWLPFR